MTAVRTIEFDGERVVMLDQRLLPHEEVYRVYGSARQVAVGIRDMVIRGAPAIGIAAAYGLAADARLALRDAQIEPEDDGPVERLNPLASGRPTEFDARMDQATAELRQARPTAVNLGWALDRMQARLAQSAHLSDELRAAALGEEARRIHEEDAEHCARMGALGADLLPSDATVLTHCNTGALATGGIGTALGVIRAAVASGKSVRVYADETRPYQQGARLTAWELMRDEIDVTLVADSAAAWVMRTQGVDAVLVGADRIAANGDSANKIGTYMLALAAKAHGIPFYVVAPTTTVDLMTETGSGIPIEERDPLEVTRIRDVDTAPEGVPVFNPAFDVTPAELITAIVTEKGIARPPFSMALRGFVEG